MGPREQLWAEAMRAERQGDAAAYQRLLKDSSLTPCPPRRRSPAPPWRRDDGWGRPLRNQSVLRQPIGNDLTMPSASLGKP
jgi:hypothetical protein